MVGKWRRPQRGRSGAEMFHVLRSQALAVSPSSIGMFPSAELPRVFGVIMDMTDEYGTATLVAFADGTAAAYLGDQQAAARLIELGVPIEAKDDYGYTALMFAANAGQDEVARLLLASNADPNATDNELATPLMFAAQHDHLGIVRQLLAARADLNARSIHGLTALGFARQNGHDRTAAVLIGAGAT